MKRLLLVTLLASVGLAACSNKDEAAAPAATPPAAPTAPKAAATSATMPNSGTILQLLQGGGYTYAEVEGQGGQRVWIAGATLQLKAGDRVQWGEYSVMQNFSSKTLQRNFDQILFVNAWGPIGGEAAQVAPHGTPPGQQPHAGMTAAPAPAGGNLGVVKSVTNGGGYSYLEIEQNGTVVWVAAPETPAKAGDKVNWADGMVMQNYTAKSLNKTFDKIVFSGGASVVK